MGRLRPIAYTNTDCFLVCFSLVDKNSLKQACTKWIAEVKATAKSCPCILVGTKMDLRDEREQENDPVKMKDVVTNEELKKWAAQYNFQAAVECSAKDRKGLNSVFLTAFKVVFQVREAMANTGRP